VALFAAAERVGVPKHSPDRPTARAPRTTALSGAIGAAHGQATTRECRCQALCTTIDPIHSVGNRTMLSLSDTALAAALAALASLLGLIISKESKVSELRQKWIDGLRKDIATLLGEATQYHASVLGLAPPAFSTLKINELMARIRLRLNLEEADHHRLFIAIIDYRDLALKGVSQEVGGQKASEISHLAALILKREWKVVKKGEVVYRWTLRVLIFGLVFLGCVLLTHFLHRSLWVTRLP
jgi:hypothetical protein